MIAETTHRNKIPLVGDWNTGEPVQDEKIFNEYWNAIYQYFKDYEFGEQNLILITNRMEPQSIDKAIEYFYRVQIILSEIEIKDNNLKAINLLEKWLEEPDEYGENFWKEFREDLQKNRFEIG